MTRAMPRQAARSLSAADTLPAASAAESIGELVEVAASGAGAPVLVVDGQWRVVGHSATSAATGAWSTAVLSRSVRDGDPPLLSSLDRDRLRAATTTVRIGPGEAITAVPLRVANAMVGSLVASSADTGRTDDAFRLVGERLAATLNMRASCGRQRQRAELLGLLLRGGRPAVALLDGAPHRLLLLPSTTPPRTSTERVRRLLVSALADLDLVTTGADGAVYALTAQRSPALPSMLRTAAAAFRSQTEHCGPLVVGRIVTSDEQLAAARHALDDVKALASHADGSVVLADERPELLTLGLIRRALLGQPEVALPQLETLDHHDREHATCYVETLHALFDAGGDVAATAECLGLHPNTVRYRVRRAVELSGLDLSDPRQRLAFEVQLRLLPLEGRPADLTALPGAAPIASTVRLSDQAI